MKNMVVIPARYKSTRLPAKPLLKETGKYMIEHVWERVRLARGVDSVVVATDDERIVKAVESFGGVAVMTSENCQSGTDRVAEAARSTDAELLINVQGDEPEMDPAGIEKLIEAMEKTGSGMGTLAVRMESKEEYEKTSVVKVVLDSRGNALYFSRSGIPHYRDGGRMIFLKHLGIYAYKRDVLERFVGLPAGVLEKAESLEQLRALENGIDIHVVLTQGNSSGIDTREDYDAFVARYRSCH